MLNIYKTKSMVKYNKEDKEYNPHFKNHEIHLFKHWIFSAGTGLGKTNGVINLILTLNDCFHEIQIYTADPSEKLYAMLKEKLKDRIIIEDIKKLPPYSEQTKYGQKLLIIDDFIEQSKAVLTRIEEYSTQSRKKLFTCCFLTQSYFDCPKKIRNQVRYLVLYKPGDKSNFTMITKKLNTDIDNDIIKKVVTNATSEEMNVAVIDLQARDENKMIRRNFELNYYKFIEKDGSHIRNPKLLKGSGIIN